MVNSPHRNARNHYTFLVFLKVPKFPSTREHNASFSQNVLKQRYYTSRKSSLQIYKLVTEISKQLVIIFVGLVYLSTFAS